MRVTTTALALVVGTLTTTAAFADEEMKRELERIRSRMEQMERDHKREMDALRNELGSGGGTSSALEAEVDQLMERVGSLEGEIRAPRKNVASRGYVDVSLNALLVAGGSEADDETLRALNAGGHDPGRRGFTSQGIELTLKGGVDPYWDALATITHVIDPETNDSFVEVEEAWMSSAAIVDGVRLRAGQFYTVFGRHNEQHAHVWEFVNAPVVNTRFLGGDGMRGLGFDASWLGPDGFPVELTGSVQNADGETMASFLGSREEEGEEEEGHGHAHGPSSTPGESAGREVRSLEELVYSFRAAMPWRPSDEHEVLFGGSWAMGPSGAGAATDARVAGLDVTWVYRPEDAQGGWPFFKLGGEYLDRKYEFDAFTDDEGDAIGAGTLNDDGWYAQAIWGFSEGWTAGLRHGRFNGEGEGHEGEFGLEDRDRTSIAFTYYVSEFSKVRIQLDREDSDALARPVNAIWLQLEFNLGEHGAHRF